MRENAYQGKLIDKLYSLFPGCEILKNDPSYRQGIPDVVIFYEDKYALLEVKAHKDAKEQPNQPYYVKKFNDMSFAAFIHPDNEKDVLDDLQEAFGTSRAARISQPK